MNYWFESTKKVCRVTARSMKTVRSISYAQCASDHRPDAAYPGLPAGKKIVIDDAAYVYLFQKNYQLR